MSLGKRKRRLTFRRKRSLDPNLEIDYKSPETLKRFVTDRGKIIPRRISGATQSQQRAISVAVKRARYLSLIPTCVAHRSERGFAGEMAAVGAMMTRSSYRPSGPRGGEDRPRENRDSSAPAAASAPQGADDAAPKTDSPE